MAIWYKSYMNKPASVIRFLLVICSSILLSACGGGEKSTTNNGGGNTGSVNIAPNITGSPQLSLNTGQNYSFTPSANDANNDPLTFSVNNLPVWAQFNSTTGQITGSPSSSQTGTYSNIVVTVSDGKTSTSMSFSITVTSNSTLANVSISWSMPTNYTDGTFINISDIGGYRLYYGRSSTNMTLVADLNDPSLLTYTFNNLATGTHYFSISSYDTSGIESNLTAPVSINI